MERTERFYLIDRLLREERRVRRERFLEALEISPATFKRDLEYLRDRFGAPILWDREYRAYRYNHADGDAARVYLPGLWFSRREIALLVAGIDRLLQDTAPGPPEITGLHRRLSGLLPELSANLQTKPKRRKSL